MRHLKHIRDLIQRVASLPITIFWVNNRSWGKLRKLSSQISLSQTMSTPSRLKAVVNFHYDYILTVKCRLKQFCTTLNLSRCLQTVPHLKWSVSFVLFLFYKVFYLPSQAGMFRCLRISDIPYNHKMCFDKTQTHYLSFSSSPISSITIPSKFQVFYY